MLDPTLADWSQPYFFPKHLDVLDNVAFKNKSIVNCSNVMTKVYYSI
jgi:hypothetical protein